MIINIDYTIQDSFDLDIDKLASVVVTNEFTKQQMKHEFKESNKVTDENIEEVMEILLDLFYSNCTYYLQCAGLPETVGEDDYDFQIIEEYGDEIKEAFKNKVKEYGIY